MRTLVHPDDRYTFTAPAAQPDEQRQLSAFTVHRRRSPVETVYFPSEMTSNQVRDTLIHRDGFPMDIMVNRAR